LKLLPAGKVVKAASFAESAKLNAPPIACPEKVRELMHGEFVMVAVPVNWKLALCVSAIDIFGVIGSGFELELNVPV